MNIRNAPARAIKVDRLLSDTAANGGLAPVDLDAPSGATRTSPEPIRSPGLLMLLRRLAQLGVRLRRARAGGGLLALSYDEPWALDVAKRSNDVAERIVDRRLLNEARGRRASGRKSRHSRHLRARNVWEGRPGRIVVAPPIPRTPPADSPRSQYRVGRRLENLRDFLLPENWDAEKARLTALGAPAPLYRDQRGPARSPARSSAPKIC